MGFGNKYKYTYESHLRLSTCTVSNISKHSDSTQILYTNTA